MKLAFWRIRHHLTSLSLGLDGQIVARINPAARIRLAKLSSAEIGRLLRPVLADGQRALPR